MAYSLVGILTGAVSVGEGRHAAALRVSDFDLAMFLTMIGMGMGVLSFTLAKSAVVILLIAILRPPKWQYRVLWGWIIGNGIIMIAVSAVYFLQCKPPQALWKTGIEGECWDPAVVNILIISGSGKQQSFLIAHPDNI